MPARKKRTRKTQAVPGVPTTVPNPGVVFVVRDWHPHDGSFNVGYTMNISVAITYIGQPSPRGGRYYVGLHREIGKMTKLEEKSQ